MIYSSSNQDRSVYLQCWRNEERKRGCYVMRSDDGGDCRSTTKPFPPRALVNNDHGCFTVGHFQMVPPVMPFGVVPFANKRYNLSDYLALCAGLITAGTSSPSISPILQTRRTTRCVPGCVCSGHACREARRGATNVPDSNTVDEVRYRRGSFELEQVISRTKP